MSRTSWLEMVPMNSSELECGVLWRSTLPSFVFSRSLRGR